jgi:ketosteroid isomerase-like protein
MAVFAAGEDVLIQADKDFAKAAAARGAEGFLSFFADDAAILPKNGAPITGKDALAKAFHETWAQPGYSLQWTPLKAEMANGNDIGYTFGTYERKRTVDGKPLVETGKYVTIWRRQRDGKWKVIVDMGN